MSEADLSSYNDSGDKIAFCRTSTETLIWKGYRGGTIPNIWVYDFNNNKTELMIDDGSINNYPMWIGDCIYFVSDRGKPMEQNLWEYNCKNKNVRQLTFYRDWSVQRPSKGDDRIIYENAGGLCIYNLKDGKIRNLNIEIKTADNHLISEKNVQNMVSSPAISPDGKKVIVTARGDLFYLEPEKIITRNLTKTSGANERNPIWSPDGKTFAYISDITGEEQIYLQTFDDNQKPIQISNSIKSKLGKLCWSPDGKKIGYSDKRAFFYNINIDTKETKKIFFDEYFGSGRFVSATWSPDSRWLAFTKGNPNWFNSIFLYSFENDKRVPRY